MGLIIVPRRKGMFVRKLGDGRWSDSSVNLEYGMRGKLGKLLKVKIKKTIKIPKGNRITKIENNKPTVGAVKITFKKK